MGFSGIADGIRSGPEGGAVTRDLRRTGRRNGLIIPRRSARIGTIIDDRAVRPGGGTEGGGRDGIHGRRRRAGTVDRTGRSGSFGSTGASGHNIPIKVGIPRRVLSMIYVIGFGTTFEHRASLGVLRALRSSKEVCGSGNTCISFL